MKGFSDDNGKDAVVGPKKNQLNEFDDVLLHIGDFGKYQWTLLLNLVVFGIAFITVFFSQIFITAVPQNHWCQVKELMNLNLSQEQRRKLAIPLTKQYPYYNRCYYKKINVQNISTLLLKNSDLQNWATGEVIQCNEWEYDFNEFPYASISAELNWVCNQEYLVASAQSIFYIGSILGNFIFGWISDQKGRTVGLLFCTATAFVASIGTANSYNFWTFASSRFLMGFAFDNIIIIPLIIVLEYSAAKKRTLVSCLGFGANFGIGVLILTWVSYFISNWRLIAYASAVPFIICFLLTCMMPESIRWYISKGKIDKILRKLRRISQVNGKNPDSGIYDEFLENITSRREDVQNVTLLDLKKTPQLAKYTLLLSTTYAISSLILDVNIYFLNRYKMSMFLSFTWYAFEMWFATLLIGVIADRWGRRFSGSLGLFLTMIFSIIFVVFSSEIVKIIMGSLIRLIVSSMQLLYCQYMTEFFPTTLRTQGAALVHFFSVIMHFTAPYVVILASTWRELPILIVGALALLNSVFILFLPETAGERLRETLQQGENFCKNKKFWPIFIVKKA